MLIKMYNKKYVFKDFLNTDNVPVARIFAVVVMLRQMPNRKCTSSLCLVAMLAHSSGVGLRHAFVVEQVQQDKKAPNHLCI